MAGTPDLFVVCKNCRAEVSPYITECPYCGHRLRKRAPKLEKGTVPRRENARHSASKPSVSRVRSRSAPRMRAVGKPVVTMALVAIPALLTVLLVADAFDFSPLVLPAGDGEYWQPITT